MFEVVLANNLGVVLKQLGEGSKAEECFHYALKGLSFLLDRQQSNGILELDAGSSDILAGIHEDDIDGLFRNLWGAAFMLGTNAAPAA